MEFTQFTKDDLERALQTPISKFEVYCGSNPGDGFSCSLYSVDIWKIGETDSPTRIVIKCFPSDPAKQEFLETSNSFCTEVRMYDTILPELINFQDGNISINHPCAPFIWAHYVPSEERKRRNIRLDSIENSIAMPDLRTLSNGGFKLRDRFIGLDLDHYSLVIEAQAKLHALSWACKCKTGIPFAQKYPYLRTNGDWYKMLDALLSQSIQISEKIVKNYPGIEQAFQHLKLFRYSIAGLYFGFEYGQSSRGNTKDTILKHCTYINDNEGSWSVLLHGDSWSNNMLFRYDAKTKRPIEVKFVDFQLAREGDPFADICYTLFVSTNKDFRDKHLTSMLHLYFDSFTKICKHFGTPSFPNWHWEEFQRRFRRATIFGGYMAITCLPIFLKSPDQFRYKEVILDYDDNSASDKPISEVFSDFHTNTGSNPILEERLVGVLEHLVEIGVI